MCVWSVSSGWEFWQTQTHTHTQYAVRTPLCIRQTKKEMKDEVKKEYQEPLQNHSGEKFLADAFFLLLSYKTRKSHGIKLDMAEAVNEKEQKLRTKYIKR